MTPDEVVAGWTHATPQEQYELRREAQAVTCPLPSCGAAPGESCGYLGPVIDAETGQTTGMEWVFRPSHQERLAAFTGGRLFGYTLRKLERKR